MIAWRLPVGILLGTLLGVVAASALQSRDPLNGHWVMILTTQQSALQFNLDSVRERNGKAAMWIREDVVYDNQNNMVTLVSKVVADCHARTVMVEQVRVFDITMKEQLALVPDATHVTPGLSAAYSFLCGESLDELPPSQPEMPSGSTTKRPQMMRV